MENRSLGRRSLFAFLVMVLALVACSKPEPPKITPKDVKVLSISNTGIEIDLVLAVENPNGIDLDARSVEATLSFDDGLEIGKSSIPRGVHLPAHKTVELRAPVSLRWKNLQQLTPYAMRESVPYTVKGQVQIGDPISIGVPFTLRGTLTRAELTKLALSALPGLGLPGLK